MALFSTWQKVEKMYEKLSSRYNYLSLSGRNMTWRNCRNKISYTSRTEHIRVYDISMNYDVGYVLVGNSGLKHPYLFTHCIVVVIWPKCKTVWLLVAANWQYFRSITKLSPSSRSPFRRVTIGHKSGFLLSSVWILPDFSTQGRTHAMLLQYFFPRLYYILKSYVDCPKFSSKCLTFCCDLVTLGSSINFYKTTLKVYLLTTALIYLQSSRFIACALGISSFGQIGGRYGP